MPEIKSDNPRRLVSLIIFSYNQERFIKDAVMGALNQSYENLEIIFSDDCSADCTYDIIKELIKDYRGNHKIILNRNEKNLGIAAHIFKAVSLANANLLVFGAGDDISLENRVEILTKEYENHPGCKAVFSNVRIIDENGKYRNMMFGADPDFVQSCNAVGSYKNLFKKKFDVWILGASAGYDRKLFIKYGSWAPGILQEDGVLSFRAILEGAIIYNSSPLVLYRRHGGSVSEPANLAQRKKLIKQSTDLIRQNIDDYKKSKLHLPVINAFLYKKLSIGIVKKRIFLIPGFLNIYLICRRLIKNDISCFI